MQETKQLILSLALIAILIPSGVYASFSNFSPINTKPGSESDVLMPHGHITFVVHDSKGNIKQYIQTDNKIVDNGLKETVDQLFGNQLIATSFTTTGATVKFIGVGTGTNAAAAGDTGLQTQRANKITGTVSTCSGICAQVQGTWAAGKLANSSSTTAAITEAGLFDAFANSTASSNLYARQTFSAINMGTSDSLQITWQITFSSVN